jgi:predicted RNA-binding Zn ribbon-like protein
MTKVRFGSMAVNESATDPGEMPMAQDATAVPSGWLRSGERADDLDLAVLLLNSLDLLEDPADRLTTVDWYAAVLRLAGHPGLADDLREADVSALRNLRDDLRTAFEAESLSDAVAVLNKLLVAGMAIPVLEIVGDGSAELHVTPAARGLKALQARLPAAVALQIAASGLRRVGVCAGSPCRCVFVDRTRAGNRRFCCDPCNDRAAAAAYRSRRAAQSG